MASLPQALEQRDSPSAPYPAAVSLPCGGRRGERWWAVDRRRRLTARGVGARGAVAAGAASATVRGRHRTLPGRNRFAAIVFMARTSTPWRYCLPGSLVAAPRRPAGGAWPSG